MWVTGLGAYPHWHLGSSTWETSRLCRRIWTRSELRPLGGLGVEFK